ncbi:MAG: hypothetical protein ACKV0T_21955 [Planctomycetales bacterium]
MTARFSFTDSGEATPVAAARPRREAQGASTASLPEAATFCHATLEVAFSPLPLADVFVPEHYEANYAYPLVVWLTAQGNPASDARRLTRSLSERNYFGAALPLGEPETLENRLVQRMADLRRQFHLHSERVFVAGCGEFGSAALQLGLAHPEWFGGMIALDAWMPEVKRRFPQYQALRGKRVFLAATEGDPTASTAVRATQRMLWTAGMAVTARSSDSSPEGEAGLFRAIDRWLIEGLD